MKKTIKSILLFLVVTQIIFINTTSMASQEVSNTEKYTQLFDTVTYATYNNDSSFNLSNNNKLDSGFIGEFLVGFSKYSNNNDLLKNKDQQIKVLNENFDISFDEKDILYDNIEFKEYVGMKTMFTKKTSENNYQALGSIYIASGPISKLNNEELLNVIWVDKRIVISYKIDKNSEYGIKITDFTLHGELLMENELNDYFNSNFTEYVNTKLGFSLMFPSVFSHENIVENQTGISISTKDNSATLSVKCFANNSNLNAEEYSKVLRQENNTNIQINSNNQSVSMLNLKDDTFIFNMYIFNKDVVYQTEMTFNKKDFENFSMYSQYIINTFKVEGTSQG